MTRGLRDTLDRLKRTGLPVVGIDPAFVTPLREKYRHAGLMPRQAVLSPVEFLLSLPPEKLRRASAGAPQQIFLHCMESARGQAAVKDWQQLGDRPGIAFTVAQTAAAAWPVFMVMSGTIRTVPGACLAWPGRRRSTSRWQTGSLVCWPPAFHAAANRAALPRSGCPSAAADRRAAAAKPACWTRPCSSRRPGGRVPFPSMAASQRGILR